MPTETIDEALTRHLGESGLWPEEATAIMTEFKASDPAKPMAHRWNEPASGYPIQLMAVLIVSLNSTAVEWIDKHAPKHWARGMFAGFDAA